MDRASLAAAVLALSLGLGLLLSAAARAHAPNVATVALTAHGDAWEVEIATPGATLDRALRQRHGDAAVEAMDDRAWKEAAVSYVRGRLALSAGDAALRPGVGGIRRGDHQTALRFVLPAPPADAAGLHVTFRAFAEDPHQVHVLRLRGAAGDPRVVLAADNGWTAHLAL